MKRRLYNEREMLTDEGLSIDTRVSAFCREIFKQCVEDGISLRDVELTMVNAIAGVSSETLLIQEHKKWLENL